MKPVSERFNRKWDTVKVVVWFVAMVEVLIVALALIAGNGCGYRNALFGFAVLGVIVGSILVSIVLVVVVGDMTLRWIEKLIRKRFR